MVAFISTLQVGDTPRQMAEGGNRQDCPEGGNYQQRGNRQVHPEGGNQQRGNRQAHPEGGKLKDLVEERLS